MWVNEDEVASVLQDFVRIPDGHVQRAGGSRVLR